MVTGSWILHIESSGSICSIALSLDSKLVAFEISKEDFAHAGQITILIRSCLNKAGISVNDLSAINCCEGPGSYTGLRVGQSVSKAMCMALEIPLISFSAFEIMFHKVDQVNDLFVLTLVKARNNEAYYLLFGNNREILEGPASLLLDSPRFRDIVDQFHPTIVINEPLEILSPLTPEIISFDARDLITLGWTYYVRKTFKSLYTFTPLYIKPPNITQPRKR